MTTPPPIPTEVTVAIPLTPAVRDAYQKLYDANEELLESTNDLSLLEPLNDIRINIGNILTKDDIYRLAANTTLFEQLTTQIKSANADLKKLKGQIETVVSRVALAGKVVGAIDKLLTVVGG